jgi:hypothetical protein
MNGKIETATNLEHKVGPRGRFALNLASGEVRIRGVEGDTVRVRSVGDERALGDVFDVSTGDDFVELRQIEKLGLGIRMFRGNGSPELEVEVPHGAAVALQTASAEIDASDLDGAKSFKTASGDVRMRRFAGALEIQTVSGDVELDGQAPVDLVARSVSGDMQVRVPRLRKLDMGTTSGDVRLDAELVGDGPFALRSISGDVTIVARGGFRVEAETITGDLSSEVPGKRESMSGRKVLAVGRPGPTLAFRSVSGDLQVVQPRDAAPESVTPPTAPLAPTPPSPPTAPSTPTAATPATGEPDIDATRLEILRELERGEISVAEATTRLGELDEVLR